MGNHSGKYDGILTVKNGYSKNAYKKFFFTVKFKIYFQLILIVYWYIYICNTCKSFGCNELHFTLSVFYYICE